MQLKAIAQLHVSFLMYVPALQNKQRLVNTQWSFEDHVLWPQPCVTQRFLLIVTDIRSF